jgi:hypothetical protein
MPRARRTILVTGCPRSGTTPVGSNLALAPHARYLYEPFNPNFGMTAMSRFYEVPGANGFSSERCDACIEAIRSLRLDLKRFHWPRDTGVRRLVKRSFGGRARLAYLRCRFDWTLETVIWKDPTACFASREAAVRHGIPVVVTVRPAAAVAASYKRMQWDSGVSNVLNSLSQIGIVYPDLIADYGKYIEDRAIGASLLWYVIYATLLRWAASTPNFHFLSLQDSIDRPIETYQALFRSLDLEWTPAVAERLRREYQRDGASKRRTPSEALPQRAHVTGRSLSDVNTYGRKLLTPDEMLRIEDITGGLWERLAAACAASGPYHLPDERAAAPTTADARA